MSSCSLMRENTPSPSTRLIRPWRHLYTGAVKTPAWTALTLLTLSLTSSPAAAEWRRLDSPNFIVIGDAGERELKNIAVQFEGFRETLGRVLSTKVTATAVPKSELDRPSAPMATGRPTYPCWKISEIEDFIAKARRQSE